MLKIIGYIAMTYCLLFSLGCGYVLFNTDLHKQYGWDTSQLSFIGFMGVISICTGYLYGYFAYQRK